MIGTFAPARFFSLYYPPTLWRFWRRLPLKQGVTVTEKKEYHALLAEAEGLLSERTNQAIHERIALRDAVCAYLAAERSLGVPLEVIRESIEGILKRAEARLSGGNGSDGHRELAQQLIDWCVRPDQFPNLQIVS